MVEKLEKWIKEQLEIADLFVVHDEYTAGYLDGLTKTLKYIEDELRNGED